MATNEKTVVVEPSQLEHAHAAQIPDELPSDPAEYQALEKKLVRKIDWRLMPVLVSMIILKYVENRRHPIAKMPWQELVISWCLGIFFDPTPLVPTL
jgi:hypothetical protein